MAEFCAFCDGVARNYNGPVGGGGGGSCGNAKCWAGTFGLVGVVGLGAFGILSADGILSMGEYCVGGVGTLAGFGSAVAVATMAGSDKKKQACAAVVVVTFLLMAFVGTITVVTETGIDQFIQNQSCGLDDNYWFDGEVPALEEGGEAHDVKYHVDLDYNHDAGAWQVDTSQTRVNVNGQEIDLNSEKVDFGNNGSLTITLDDGQVLNVSDVDANFDDGFNSDLKTDVTEPSDPNAPDIDLVDNKGQEVTLTDIESRLIDAKKLPPVTELGLETIDEYVTTTNKISYWVGEDWDVFRGIIDLNETFEIGADTYQLVEANPGEVTNPYGVKVVNLDAHGVSHPPKVTRRRLAGCGPVLPSFKAADVLRRRRMMRGRKPNRTETVLRKMLNGAF